LPNELCGVLRGDLFACAQSYLWLAGVGKCEGDSDPQEYTTTSTVNQRLGQQMLYEFISKNIACESKNLTGVICAEMRLKYSHHKPVFADVVTLSSGLKLYGTSPASLK
jgi:hypothetical protein